MFGRGYSQWVGGMRGRHGHGFGDEWEEMGRGGPRGHGGRGGRRRMFDGDELKLLLLALLAEGPRHGYDLIREIEERTGGAYAPSPGVVYPTLTLLDQAETLFAVGEPEEALDPAALAQLLHRRMPVYDKDREGHYNLISALHKAVRGSDPQAALYYLARMLVAGEEPLYLLRRMVRMASEDIGLADPQALVQCLAAKDSYDFLGSPEGELAIAGAIVYLATAPKSNAVYKGWKAAARSAKETGSLMPPANILNAPTKLMKQIGYGKDYAYDHDAPDAFSGDDYWPEGMGAQTFYEPTPRGFEAKIGERLAYWQKLRAERGGA